MLWVFYWFLYGYGKFSPVGTGHLGLKSVIIRPLTFNLGLASCARIVEINL